MSAQETVWVKPTIDDLNAVLMEKLRIAAGTFGASADRTEPLLRMMVERMRGAVRTGGRVPVSEEAGTIPPESVFHVMILTARALIDSNPQLSKVARIGDDFTRMVYWSEQWIHGIDNGKPVSKPSSVAEPAEGEEVIAGANWGNSFDHVDLSTDG